MIDQRVVVVGASSGLGRTIGLGLAERGARVALLARRADRLEAAVAEAGERALSVVCDVTDPRSCRAAIDEVALAFGGIDALVYSTGTITVAPIEDVDAETWANLFATNVAGASLATAAALSHLAASRGIAIYLSSVSASLTRPWPKFGSYITSKAALDKLVEIWQSEHPEVRFTRFVVGDCAGGPGHSGSEFIASVDPEAAADAINEWLRMGLMNGDLIDPNDLVEAVRSVIENRSAVPILALAPPGNPST